MFQFLLLLLANIGRIFAKIKRLKLLNYFLQSYVLILPCVHFHIIILNRILHLLRPMHSEVGNKTRKRVVKDAIKME